MTPEIPAGKEEGARLRRRAVATTGAHMEARVDSPSIQNCPIQYICLLKFWLKLGRFLVPRSRAAVGYKGNGVGESFA